MPNKVLLKKSSVAAKVPLTTDLDYGELALNYTDEKLYFKNASNAIKSFTAPNNGTLGSAAGTAGSTNTTVALNFSAAYSANTSTNVTINPVVGPAITALASTMTGATTGFIKKSAQDTYVLDTNTYLTAESDTLATVTGRGATTATAITITNATASTTTTTGALIVTGGVGIGGALNAISKSFIINHPTKPNMKLRHGSLEGPEFGVYVRGRLNGKVIELPEYWTKLVDPYSITVQLTAIGKGQKLYVEDIRGNKVYIGNDGLFAGDPNCFYLVQAERVDIEKMNVEIE